MGTCDILTDTVVEGDISSHGTDGGHQGCKPDRMKAAALRASSLRINKPRGSVKRKEVERANEEGRNIYLNLNKEGRRTAERSGGKIEPQKISENKRSKTMVSV